MRARALPACALTLGAAGAHRPSPAQFLHRYSDSYRRFKFDDAALLAKWSQHSDYQ